MVYKNSEISDSVAEAPFASFLSPQPRMSGCSNKADMMRLHLGVVSSDPFYATRMTSHPFRTPCLLLQAAHAGCSCSRITRGIVGCILSQGEGERHTAAAVGGHRRVANTWRYTYRTAHSRPMLI